MRIYFIIMIGLLAGIGGYIVYVLGVSDGDVPAKDIEMVLEFPFKNVFPGEERYFDKSIVITDATYIFSSYPQITGNPALIHHGIIMHSGAENRYCGADSPVMSTITATGTELNEYNLEDTPYGVFLKKGDQLYMSVHISNPGDKIESGMFKWTLRGSANRKPVGATYFGVVDFCKIEQKKSGVPYEFVIPSGITRYEKTMERPYIIPEDGTLVAWGGHLHTYGISLTFIKNGKEMDTFFAEKNTRDSVDRVRSVYIPFRILDVPISLKKGDIIDMRAVYEKPVELFYPGAMANGYLFIDFESR